MIIVLFARREVAICATSWKVLYRKFVYFSTSEEFPPASNYEVVILLIEFLDELQLERYFYFADISFPFPFTIYLLSPDFISTRS